MRARTRRRLAARVAANATAAGMAVTEWLGLTRAQRKALKRKTKGVNADGSVV